MRIQEANELKKFVQDEIANKFSSQLNALESLVKTNIDIELDNRLEDIPETNETNPLEVTFLLVLGFLVGVICMTWIFWFLK